MILINSTPANGRVLLDANNTPISITSSNGATHYFRAEIAIEGDPFDVQGWSRINAYTANKDIKRLYNAYFEFNFFDAFSSSIVQQDHLIKTVGVVIKEYTLSADLLTDSLTLPSFKMMYSQNPQTFDDTEKVQFLDIQPEVLRILRTSKIVIPLFVNAADGESITCKIMNGDVSIHEETITPGEGKRAFLYALDLATLTTAEEDLYYTLGISCGSTEIIKTLKIITLPNYPVQALAFRNNFGYWIRAYFDGDLEVVNSYKGDFYLQEDRTERAFEISEDAVYTLNTGSLLENEKSIIRQISKALEAKIWLDGQWIDIVNKSKRYREIADSKHTFEEDLVFNLSLNKSVDNVGVGPISSNPILQIISVEDSGDLDLEVNFNVQDYFYQHLSLGISSDGVTFAETIIDATSPEILTAFPGTFYYRLSTIGYDPVVHSNIVSHTSP